MKKLLLFFLFAIPAFGQVTITSNTPGFGWVLMSGAQRDFGFYVTGGATGLVNYSVVSGSATLSCSTNCPGTVHATITAANGTCSVTGSGPSNYVLNSTSDTIIRGISVDDTSKHADILIHSCSTVVTTFVEPAYDQVFQGQADTLQSYVLGLPPTQQDVTWAITTQPTGGDGALSDTNNRDTRFSATVSGTYEISATSVNGSVVGKAKRYVVPATAPREVSPDKTRTTACFYDPSLTGTHYDVGAGFPYPDLTTVPGNLNPGDQIHIHNTGTGDTQVLLHNAMVIAALPTYDQPIDVCGVANANGWQAGLDGSNATENPTNSPFLAGLGGIKIAYVNSHFGEPYELGSTGPDYVNIRGLTIVHFNSKYSFYPPGSATLSPYGVASGTYTRAGRHQHWDGIHCSETSWCVLNNNNTSTGGRAYAMLNQFMNGHIENFGDFDRNSFSAHGLYLEAPHTLTEGNLIEKPVLGDNGDWIKQRGGDSIIRYNSFLGYTHLHVIEYPDEENSFQFQDPSGNLGMPLGTFTATSIDAPTPGPCDTQISGVRVCALLHGSFPQTGSFPVTAFSQINNSSGLAVFNITGFTNPANNGTFLVYDSSPTTLSVNTTTAVAETHAATAILDCGSSLWCSVGPDNITLGDLEIQEEALAEDYAYGNIMANASSDPGQTGRASTTIQYGSYSAPQECGPCTNMTDRNGRLWFWSNTVDRPNAVFATANLGTSGFTAKPQYAFTSVFAQNNSFWNNPAYSFSFNIDAAAIYTLKTNLFQSGVMNITTPINGGAGTGWGNGLNTPTNFAFSAALPLNTHMTGISSANFLTTTVPPYNLATYSPFTGSALIGAGSTVTAPEIAHMPVRFQPDPINGGMHPRLHVDTIGAMDVDNTQQPTMVSLTITPASVTVPADRSNVGYIADCLWSNGIHQECEDQAVWTSSAPSDYIFFNSQIPLAQAFNASTGTVTATPYFTGGVFGTSSFTVGGGGPTVVSITLAPSGTVGLVDPNTIQFTATCMLSDGSSGPCSGPSWSSDSPICTINSSGLLTPTHMFGICQITATQGVTSLPTVVNVTVPPPPVVIFGAGAKIGVGSGNGVKVF